MEHRKKGKGWIFMGQEGDMELKYAVLNVMLICLLLSLTGCGADKKAGRENRAGSGQEGEAALLMWGQCRTAFPMRWNYPKKDIMHLP